MRTNHANMSCEGKQAMYKDEKRAEKYEMDDGELESVAGGGQDGDDLLIVNNGDGSDFFSASGTGNLRRRR
jgi:hypothetical protein